MELAKSPSRSQSSEAVARAAPQEMSSPIPIEMKRSVSFNDMVAYAEAYSPTEYKREGYKQKSRKKFWRFENERHDKDDQWYYCEIEEGDEDGNSSAAKSAKQGQDEDEWDPVLAELMKSMGKGFF